MNSGHPQPHQKDSGEPFCWILRPTLQLKVKANSWKEFRPTTPPPREVQVNPSAELRPTLQLKIKANSWNEFNWKIQGQLLEWIQVIATPTRKIQVNPSAEF